jgi:hypothetical protein
MGGRAVKALFVGQRVRIVYVPNPRLRHLQGRETFIVDRSPPQPQYDRSSWLVGIRDPDFPWRWLGASDDNLEPILIDGIESETTEETTQPEQVTA